MTMQNLIIFKKMSIFLKKRVRREANFNSGSLSSWKKLSRICKQGIAFSGQRLGKLGKKLGFFKSYTQQLRIKF